MKRSYKRYAEIPELMICQCTILRLGRLVHARLLACMRTCLGEYLCACFSPIEQSKVHDQHNRMHQAKAATHAIELHRLEQAHQFHVSMHFGQVGASLTVLIS
jgi:hypothetical protein